MSSCIDVSRNVLFSLPPFTVFLIVRNGTILSSDSHFLKNMFVLLEEKLHSVT